MRMPMALEFPKLVRQELIVTESGLRRPGSRWEWIDVRLALFQQTLFMT